MSLEDDLRAALAPRPFVCKWGRCLEEMTDEQRELTEQIEPCKLAKIMVKNDRPVSDNTISLHRKGECGCLSLKTSE